MHVHTRRAPSMHVWEQECMALHAQEIMAMQEPQQTLMHTCTRSQAHVWKVIAPCFLTIYMSWIAVICHWEKISQTTVKPKCDNAGHVKNMVFLIAGFLGFHRPKFKCCLFHLLSLGGTVRCCSLFSTNVTTSASLPRHGVTSNVFLR